MYGGGGWLYESDYHLKEGTEIFEIQAAFSTTKPCVSKTEQRPSPQKGLGFLAANS